MTHFHAVMIDETGCEVGVSVTARSREAAHAKLRENYPEFRRCVQLESPADTRRRERRLDLWAKRVYEDQDPYDYD